MAVAAGRGATAADHGLQHGLAFRGPWRVECAAPINAPRRPAGEGAAHGGARVGGLSHKRALQCQHDGREDQYSDSCRMV